MKEIVVVRLSSLGDVAMLVPVFLSFHQAYPSTKIRLITRERFSPIFSHLDFVSLDPIDKGNSEISILKLIHFAIQLSRSHCKILLDVHDVLRTKILRTICRLNGSQVEILDKGRAEKKALIKENGDKSKWLKTTLQRYADVFEKAGFPFELGLHFLNKVPKESGKTRIGISPFAKHSSKEYSLEKMKELILLLSSHEDFELTIFGFGDREDSMASDMANGIPNVKNLIGKMSFSKELNLISSLDLMISMDSGNGHLAANFGIPVITLWGTTHPKLGFGPYNQPLLYSIFPNEASYPLLPVSIFGPCDSETYARAIDSIIVEEIYRKVMDIIQ
jgi:ADP-heptose:LPS heptosyltransferase